MSRAGDQICYLHVRQILVGFCGVATLPPVVSEVDGIRLPLTLGTRRERKSA